MLSLGTALSSLAYHFYAFNEIPASAVLLCTHGLGHHRAGISVVLVRGARVAVDRYTGCPVCHRQWALVQSVFLVP